MCLRQRSEGEERAKVISREFWKWHTAVSDAVAETATSRQELEKAIEAAGESILLLSLIGVLRFSRDTAPETAEHPTKNYLARASNAGSELRFAVDCPRPSGVFKRLSVPQRFPMQIRFVWRFCMGAQGA